LGSWLWGGDHHHHEEQRMVGFPAGRGWGDWHPRLQRRSFQQAPVPPGGRGPSAAPNQPGGQPQQNGTTQQSDLGQLWQLLQGLLQNRSNQSPNLQQLLQQLRNLLQQGTPQNATPPGSQ
jgi:hypothetical protein